MLQLTARGLASEVALGSAIHNALLESFVIHVRNLCDFLWLGGAKKDWVLARNFFPTPKAWSGKRPEQSDLLKTARRRASELCTHLSYGRIQLSEADRQWPYKAIADEIIQAIHVFDRECPPIQGEEN